MTVNNEDKSPYRLDGKLAVITGAASGIGEACARLFAQMGASLVLTDINADKCQALANELSHSGTQAKAMAQDVADEKTWQALSDELIRLNQGYDILLNNAGIYIGGKLEDNTAEQMQRIHEVNVQSVMMGTKQAAELMKPDGHFGKGGSVINFSSIAGLVGVPGHSIYGSTKGAVRSFSKHTAVEFARFGYGIRVNSLHPGLIDTAMGAMVFDDFVEIGLAASVEEARGLLEQMMIPMGRLGSVQDIANAALFLASNASSYITGSELTVDGGFTAS